MANLIWNLFSGSDSQQNSSKADFEYLAALTNQSLEHLVSNVPYLQIQTLHPLRISIQSLCKRYHLAIVGSASRHTFLSHNLTLLIQNTNSLEAAVPNLDHATLSFSGFGKMVSDSANSILRRRQRAMILYRNCERLVDVMSLPTLLDAATSSLISRSATLDSSPDYNATSNSSALDLNSHILRLQSLYPASLLINSVSVDARESILTMASSLLATLRQKTLKLAVALRVIGWLRRVFPDLGLETAALGSEEREQCLIGIFLACRIASLTAILSDLEPIRVLAEKEIGSDSSGQYSEQYLKRYIEIFREQSFSMISMLRNVFPSTGDNVSITCDNDYHCKLLHPVMSPASFFPLRLIDMLIETLTTFLGNVKNQHSHDGLITQVMYCSASLGKLGSEFSVVLACIGPSTSGDRWENAIRRHIALASRIESTYAAVGNISRKPKD